MEICLIQCAIFPEHPKFEEFYLKAQKFSASRFHKRKSWSNQYSVHIFCYAICWSTSSGIIKISKNYAMKPKVLELKFAFLSGLKGKIKWKRQFSLEKIWICSFHFIKSYSQWNAGECFSTLLCVQQFTWKCESKFRKTIVKCSASLIKTWMNWISMEKWEFDVQTSFMWCELHFEYSFEHWEERI